LMLQELNNSLFDAAFNDQTGIASLAQGNNCRFQSDSATMHGNLRQTVNSTSFLFRIGLAPF